MGGWVGGERDLGRGPSPPKGRSAGGGHDEDDDDDATPAVRAHSPPPDARTRVFRTPPTRLPVAAVLDPVARSSFSRLSSELPTTTCFSAISTFRKYLFSVDYYVTNTLIVLRSALCRVVFRRVKTIRI